MQLPEYAQDQKKLDINLKTLMQEGQCIQEEDMLAEEIAQLSKEFK